MTQTQTDNPLVDLNENVELPLLVDTPAEWASQAMTKPMVLLNDHAHLEKKAATNALELLLRWPEPNPPENWVHAMTAVARDEVEHLAVVTRILSRRGGRLTKYHRNQYAADLRDTVRSGKGQAELIDRLIVSALIEARSCERFKILAEHCDDIELAKLYQELYSSEAGHYKLFLGLARELPDIDDDNTIESRWQEMLKLESDIIQKQKPGPTMHAWPG